MQDQQQVSWTGDRQMWSSWQLILFASAPSMNCRCSRDEEVG